MKKLFLGVLALFFSVIFFYGRGVSAEIAPRGASAVNHIHQRFFVAPGGTTNTQDPLAGTKDLPWDLQTALSQPASVRPGDEICLKGGTYRGYFVSELTGTQEEPITVVSYSSEPVIIESPGPRGDGLCINGSWSAFRGIKIIGTKPDFLLAQRNGKNYKNRFINIILEYAGAQGKVAKTFLRDVLSKDTAAVAARTVSKSSAIKAVSLVKEAAGNPPNKPEQIVAYATWNSTVVVKWADSSTAANPAGNFTIDWTKDAGITYSAPVRVSASQRYYIARNLTAQAHYTFRVKAQGAGGTSDYGTLMYTDEYSDSSPAVTTAGYIISAQQLQKKPNTGRGVITALKIKTNAMGERVILGRLMGTVDFGWNHVLRVADDPEELRNNNIGKMFIAKYSASGACLWARLVEEYVIDYLKGAFGLDDKYGNITEGHGNIAISSAGDVAITGQKDNRLIVSKYASATGAPLWIKTIPVAATSNSFGNAVIFDNDNNVVVAGGEITPDQARYAIVYRFPDKWVPGRGLSPELVARFTGTAKIAVARDAAIDTNNAIVITGDISNVEHSEFGDMPRPSIFVHKYGVTGALWKKEIAADRGSMEMHGYSLAVDRRNNAIVVLADINMASPAIFKFLSTGGSAPGKFPLVLNPFSIDTVGRIWSFDWAQAQIDGSGNIFILRGDYCHCGAGDDFRKYSPAGDLIWSKFARQAYFPSEHEHMFFMKSGALVGDSLVMIGDFEEQIHLDQLSLKALEDGDRDMFIAKYSDSEVFVDDIFPPAIGMISVGPNDAAAVSGATVKVSCFAYDAAGGMGFGSKVRFSEDGSTWFSPVDCAASVEYTFLPPEGKKTLYAQFQDSLYNWGGTYQGNTVSVSAIRINNGAKVTKNPEVTLLLSPFAGDGTTRMRFANSIHMPDNPNDWSTPETYSAGKFWRLPGGNGVKNVYVQFTEYGTWSKAYSASIILDRAVSPTGTLLVDAAFCAMGGTLANAKVRGVSVTP